MSGLPEVVEIRLPDGALGGWPVLIDALKRAKEATGLTMVFGGLIEQIRAQMLPPEPTGLGAVVKVPGLWEFTRTRMNPPWLNVTSGSRNSWEDVLSYGEPELLAEGWSE